MTVAPKKRLTATEYLAIERLAETKSEFLDGDVFAMSGGSHNHSLIATNISGELRNRLKGKSCQSLNSDMRLKVEATDLYAYPDVQIACGELRFEDEMKDALLNPTVIFEVLSPSTAAWDRGQKFWHYRHLESLQEYVLVSQDHWLVERYRRQENGAWLLESLDTAGAILKLDSVGCELPLNEIYAGVELRPQGKR